MTDKMPDRVYIDGFRKIHQYKVGTWYNEAHEDGSIEFIRTDLVQELVTALENVSAIRTNMDDEVNYLNLGNAKEIAQTALKQFRGD